MSVANQVGVIRASVFLLKGGALTVSAAEEVIQEQLVAHGASVANAKTTAHLLVQTVGPSATKMSGGS